MTSLRSCLLVGALSALMLAGCKNNEGDDDVSPGDDDVTQGGDDDMTMGGDDDVTTGGDDDVTTGGDDDVTTGGDDDVTTGGDDDSSTAPASASATLVPAQGYSITGTVTFTQNGGNVTVVADVANADPGMHGFHVHETGDCSASDYSSAGGHFNPTGATHACPPATPRHAGDLGNITVAENGTGHLELTTDLISVNGGANSVVGKAVIVHSGTDDCTTDPAGNSGARIACGVIQAK